MMATSSQAKQMLQTNSITNQDMLQTIQDPQQRESIVNLQLNNTGMLSGSRRNSGELRYQNEVDEDGAFEDPAENFAT